LTDNTDQLSEVTKKLDTLLKLYYNADMINKLLLDKVNKLSEQISIIKDQLNNQTNNSTSTELITATQPSLIEEADISDNEFTNVEEIPDPIKEPEKIEARKQKTSSKKTKELDVVVPVFQSVTDNTGKNIPLAIVEVYDLSNKLITSCRTDALGKWSASISPGNYYVKITKNDAKTKKLMESKVSFNVNYSQTPIEIKQAILVR